MKTIDRYMAVLLLVACSACDSDDLPPDGDRSLTFELSALPELGSDFVYEGWLVGPNGPRSTGRFTVDRRGSMVPARFEINDRLADSATAAAHWHSRPT